MSRWLRAVLALVLLLSLMLPGLAEQAAEPTEEPGFEYLKADPANVNTYYTAIRIPGFEPTLYAFTDRQGATRYRVYGRLDKKKGMYEASLSSALEGDTRVFTVDRTGDKPIRDKYEGFARAKAVKLDDSTLPEGYRRTNKKGVCYFINLFKQREYRILGELEGQGQAFYPPVYAKPRVGALAIDIDQDSDRFKLEGQKYFSIPREYRGGVASAVFVVTQEGERVSVMTDKPLLDRTRLK